MCQVFGNVYAGEIRKGEPGKGGDIRDRKTGSGQIGVFGQNTVQIDHRLVGRLFLSQAPFRTLVGFDVGTKTGGRVVKIGPDRRCIIEICARSRGVSPVSDAPSK